MKKVAIVDGFSSGKFIAKELYDMGIDLVHISSCDDLHSYYYKGFDFSIYKKTHINSDITKTIDFIREFGADCILAGAESGVYLTDKLNNEFCFSYKNDFATASARRNKYEMINTLSKAGLAAAKQGKFANWNEANSWIRHHNEYPIVLKPLESAGSDSVFICNNEEEAKSAFDSILGTSNKLNILNEYVLFQEFLDGTEYVVNFVSLEGRQLVTEIVKYTKRKLFTGNIVYDIDEILDSTYEEFLPLVNYTKEVAHALGIKNGPSHAEVMFTKNGPVLVEIAARTDGILRPEISLETTGLGQIKATALSIAEPKTFKNLLANPNYILKNHSFNVCLISNKEGFFSSINFLNEMKKLPSFKTAIFYIDDGDVIEKTTDVFSQPGTVYLVHKSLDLIWQDYEKIREMEIEGIYYQIN